MATMTTAAYKALTTQQQTSFALSGGVVTPDAPVVGSAPTSGATDLFETPVETTTTTEQTQYSVQANRIWMNLELEIGGHTLKLPSVEITGIYYAQRKLKGQDERIDEVEVMSLIKTINAHGVDAVNTAATVNVRFGAQGQSAKQVVDLLA